MFRFFAWLFCLVMLLSGGLGCSQQPKDGGKGTAEGGTEDTLHFPVTVTVDYNQSLEDMVKAGKYDYANENIVAENFPVEGTGTVESEVVLVHFDRFLKPDEALQEMEQERLRPATLPELLALCAQYPDLQRKFPLVAIDIPSSVSPGSRVVVFADKLAGKRRLQWSWSDMVQEPGRRFLVVRK